MQTLYLQQIQVSGDDDGRLQLAQHKEQQIPPEIQLRRLGVGQPLGAGVYLQNGGQYHAAHPNGQHRVKRRHGRAVVCDGIDLVHGGLHHFREILAVGHRVSA